MSTFRSSMFGGLPTVVKNLLIINVVMYLLKLSFGQDDLGRNMLDTHLGMYAVTSPNFRPWQIVTHMFMHADFLHLFTNMFGLFMFGGPIEQRWGAKRFLTYYMVCGLGAAALHSGVNAVEIQRDVERVASYGVDVDAVRDAANRDLNTMPEADAILTSEIRRTGAPEDEVAQLFFDHQGTIIGASGAVFGILLAFGMFFPNVELIMLFLPIPIKAKYFVVLYGLFELYAGLKQSPGDNVAHFAHLGGMLFGFILIRHWRKRDMFF